MKFDSHFNCGDTAWIFYGRYYAGAQEATVGQIRFEYTETTLYEDDKTGYGEPVKTLKEVYMCKETGVGSGTLLTYGEHIFKTKEECEVVYADKIAEQEREKLERVVYQKQLKLGKEKQLRAELEEIERIKAEDV